ncbi:dihydroorotate dehydrogenase [Candidatus Beckwithbacteria bacterium CG10_big_fil_rev_8_21_14_0_10_34_10]|uniref:Dihydroorotate dehydrogenase n=1 Tax=Candidatus Beckwithbacteria bacterium CG10_big_fil_rev_8_21_14_0_10_34_10 TaxID=1974495 RepID=A0A2H0WAL8_9BACT|nr:MAG: dihydroorotate dehydrogenase [Candidatus Beckwithbacteria bacterium CG10_big_fil_rev_8_21_14_0_10_34_10]
MKGKINLSCVFCNVKFKSPLISPSGIVVDQEKIIDLSQIKGVGGLTTKSSSILPREGHSPPTVSAFKAGFINAVGLKNPGMINSKREIMFLKKRINKPIIASVFGTKLADFSILVKEISESKPDIIELNLSCPNVDDEFGKPFATDPLLTAMAVIEAKKVVQKIPIIAKLTPNTPYLNRVAYEVEKAGADGISAINTVGPGMLINLKKRKPILSNCLGGVSGPAIKPIALRCVNEIKKTVKIPIIGMGGVETGKDALEMIMAGATLVGVGSAIYQGGFKIFDKIIKEMKEIMTEEKISSINSIRGSLK